MEYVKAAVKSIIIYIIVADVMINLVNDEKYKRYVRMFTGLILIVLIVSPAMKLVNRVDVFTSRELDYGKLSKELSIYNDMEDISSKADEILNSDYCNQLEKDISVYLKKSGLEVINVTVKTENNTIKSVTVKVDKDKYIYQQEIKDKIEQGYNIDKEKLRVETDNFGKNNS